MIQTTIGDFLQPFIELGNAFLQYVFMMLTNPIIAGLIILYILARFTRWYLKRQKEKKEMEYLQKPTYEEIERRLLERDEELRALRRKIRQRAFRE